MARLEAECGHQLFERTSKGAAPTAYGRALYARIDQLMAIMDEIESDTLSLQRSRKLKVASTIGVLLYTGMAFTTDFEAAFPEIELFVEEGSDRRVEEWLSSGAVEIGFLAGSIDRARYDAWLFSRHRHVLDVREDDPLAERSFVEHRDLDGRIVALLSRDYRPYENNVRWLAEAGAVPRQLIEVVEGFTGSQLVASGRAVSITTDYSSQMRDAAGVVSVPFKNPEQLLRRLSRQAPGRALKPRRRGVSRLRPRLDRGSSQSALLQLDGGLLTSALGPATSARVRGSHLQGRRGKREEVGVTAHNFRLWRPASSVNSQGFLRLLCSSCLERGGCQNRKRQPVDKEEHP